MNRRELIQTIAAGLASCGAPDIRATEIITPVPEEARLPNALEKTAFKGVPVMVLDAGMVLSAFDQDGQLSGSTRELALANGRVEAHGSRA